MVFYKIDVDEQVWQFLKKNAEPFEDTPNSVLKRLLFERGEKGAESYVRTHTENDFPTFPPSVPAALAQTLEVIYGVKKLGLSRTLATKLVAKKRGITPQSVYDKYSRQLDKRAYDIDRLLESKDSEALQALLLARFTNNKDMVQDFFQSLAA